MKISSIKNTLLTFKRPLPVLLASTSNIAWGALLGLLVFLPFLGVLILGLQNYNMMETVRSAEKVKKAGIKVNLFHQQIDKQLLKLEQTLQKTVQAAGQQVGFSGLSGLSNKDHLIALAVKVDATGRTPVGLGNMQTYVEQTLQADSASEIRFSFRQLTEQRQRGVEQQGIWMPKNSIIGEAYLYCWRQNKDTGFCTLIAAKDLYEKLWGTEPLKQQRQQFSIHDYFNQDPNTAPLQSAHRFVINMRGLIFSVSLVSETVDEEPISDSWLFLAMILPLLGLAIAIAWMIFIYHQRQAKNAQKLLHGTQEIAHELRTPLSNISLYTGLIMRSEISKERDQYGKVLDNEMHRITRIIDNAIALMRGEPVTGFEKSRPQELLNTLANQYRRYLQEAGCSLSIDNSIDGVYSYPKQATEQILVNLISNAKKYAPNSHVTLGGSYANKALRFWLQDEANDKINNKLSAQPSGLGLGLMTCERLAHGFAGKFEVNINKTGRCYSVSFPIQ